MGQVIEANTTWVVPSASRGILGGRLAAGAEPAQYGAVPAPINQVNPLIDIVLPRLYPIIVMDVSPSLGDATLINRINMVVALGMMDAAAPYPRRPVGMYTRIPRRPEANAAIATSTSP